MEWQDEGVLIASRRHGESGAIIEVFTSERGRHAGFVPGGAGRRMAPVLQPGAQLQLQWRARLADQMGTYRVEPVRARAAMIFNDPPALAALTSATALLAWALPEREAQPHLYGETVALMDGLALEGWPARYALWELTLLREMGFGPDISACAVTGARDELAFVSPKSGRSVSRQAGADWADRLLPLPGFLLDREPCPTAADVVDALALTGHFLDQWLGTALERQGLPEARARLVDRLARSGRVEAQKG